MNSRILHVNHSWCLQQSQQIFSLKAFVMGVVFSDLRVTNFPAQPQCKNLSNSRVA